MLRAAAVQRVLHVHGRERVVGGLPVAAACALLRSWDTAAGGTPAAAMVMARLDVQRLKARRLAAHHHFIVAGMTIVVVEGDGSLLPRRVVMSASRAGDVRHDRSIAATVAAQRA